jgi:hypothetical protein
VDTVSKHAIHIDLSYPPGWVPLPVGFSKNLRRDTQLDEWAAAQARSLLGSAATPEQIHERASNLAELTIACRAHHDHYGLAFYPDGGSRLVATIDVKSYAPDREDSILTMDLLEEIYARRTADIVGDIHSSRTLIPSGPAIRIRSKRVEEGDSRGQGTLTESVTYAIRPPDVDQAVVMTMTWTSIEVGDELTAMGDAIARTIRVSPA